MDRYARYHKLHDELREIVHELDKYYDIDKIKFDSVYVWTKDGEEPFTGENVFDIHKDEIVYFVKDHVIPHEVMPIVKKIQDKLKEIATV